MSPRKAFSALALLVAWSCGDEEQAPPPGTNGPDDAGESSGGSSGTSGNTGAGGTNGGEPAGGTSGAAGSDARGGAAGSAGPGGEGGESTGGTGGTTTGGTGGSAGFPSCASDSEGGGPPDISALCDTAGAWGDLVDIPLMDGAAQLVAVTPDELTIAWYGNANMDTKFYVADRASVTASFEPGEELEYRDYLTLSPDGLRLVALSDEGRLVELVRADRGEAFGAPAEGSFSMLDADAAANDLGFLAAVISPDDRTFYYLVNDEHTDHPLHVSRRTGNGPWPVGTAIQACEFQTHNGVLRQPTGVSADGLTLFFNDFVRGISRAAWRATESSPFVWFVDLGSRAFPRPNADCSRLYYTAPTGPAYAEAQ